MGTRIGPTAAISFGDRGKARASRAPAPLEQEGDERPWTCHRSAAPRPNLPLPDTPARTIRSVDDIRRIDASTARRFLVAHHELVTPRSLEPGLDGVRAAFARLGSVQFDPLGVAGRNHDLVLHARVAEYQSAWTDELLYGTRELFEAYNKGLSLLPTPELPWYRVGWDVSSDFRTDLLSKYEATVMEVLERIRVEGPLSSLDFERKAAVDWWWGPTSESRAVLEALSASGIVGLARREGNKRYFDLMERLVPQDLLAVRPSERDQRRHKLLSRYRAHGLLGASGSGELWIGTGKGKRVASDHPDAIIRDELRDELRGGR